MSRKHSSKSKARSLQQSYDEGFRRGNDNGWSKGEDQGSTKGRQAGNADGYETGYQKGENQGYSIGEKKGREAAIEAFRAEQKKQQEVVPTSTQSNSSSADAWGSTNAPTITGDWTCSCGAQNYANRFTCHKRNCGAARAGGGGAVAPRDPNEKWECLGCNTKNFPAKHICGRCSVQKGKTEIQEDDEGYWNCIACRYENKPNTDVCYRNTCGVAKGEKGDVWNCSCGAENFAYRSTCHKRDCGLPKGSAADDEEEAPSMRWRGGDSSVSQSTFNTGGGWCEPTAKTNPNTGTSQTNTTERGEEPTAANTSTTQTVATEGREESNADTSTTQTIVEPTVETTSTTAHATEAGEEPAFENTTKSTEASGHADEVRNSEEGERRDAVVVEASVNNGEVEKVEVETARDIGGEGDADGGNA